jgi:hypothetical protein
MVYNLIFGEVNNYMNNTGHYHDNQSISYNFKFIQISECVSNLMDKLIFRIFMGDHILS